MLDLRKAAGFTDFFVICSGTNPRQIRAIADAVMEALAAKASKPAHVEGYDRSEWVLLDYFDFIVHVFAPETRTFYGLERLWGNAEQARDVVRLIAERDRRRRSACALRHGRPMPSSPSSSRRRAPPAATCSSARRAARSASVCWRSIRPLTPPLCDRCGDPLPTWRPSAVWRLVPARAAGGLPAHVDRARAIGALRRRPARDRSRIEIRRPAVAGPPAGAR